MRDDKLLTLELIPFLLLLVNFLVWLAPRKVLWLVNKIFSQLKGDMKKSLESAFLRSFEGLHLIVLSFIVMVLITVVWWLADLGLRKASLTAEVPLVMSVFLTIGIIAGIFSQLINPQFLSFSEKHFQLRPLIVRYAKFGRSAVIYGWLLLFIWNSISLLGTNEEYAQLIQSPKIWPAYIGISAVVSVLGVSLVVISIFLVFGLIRAGEPEEMLVYTLEYLIEASDYEDSMHHQSDFRMMLSEAANYAAKIVKEKVYVIQDIKMNKPFGLIALGFLWNRKTRVASIKILQNLIQKIKEKKYQELLKTLAGISSVKSFVPLGKVKKMGIIVIRERKGGKMGIFNKLIVLISSILTIINIVLTLTGVKF